VGVGLASSPSVPLCIAIEQFNRRYMGRKRKIVASRYVTLDGNRLSQIKKEDFMTIGRSDEQESNFPAGLSNPVRRALTSAGYTRLELLSAVTEAEIGKLHGVEANAITKLRDALAAYGLSFRQAPT
jgi:hypothetical protein